MELRRVANLALQVGFVSILAACGSLNTTEDTGLAAAPSSTPDPVTVSKIMTGWYHSCAITSNGGLKCWGYNSSGQLGNDTSTSSSLPVAVSGLSSGISSVAIGQSHTCALTTGGAVKCWGLNSNGQLGDNSTTAKLTPVDVIGLSSGVVAIAAGRRHTCALTAGGAVKCWGYNVTGELGDNTTSQRLSPVDVTGLGSGIIAIAAGGIEDLTYLNSDTCALTSGGAVKCWGYNAFGQLGNNSTSDSPIPVDVSGLGSGVASIASGAAQNCARMSVGTVKCWGRNDSGQLGDNSTTQRLTPVDVSGLTGVSAIAVGNFHGCALLGTGGMKCWGPNAYGRLGDGTTTQRLTPVDVSGLQSGVAGISGGGLHTCAVMSSGVAKCWGYNFYGQLGNNSTTQSLIAVDVLGLP